MNGRAHFDADGRSTFGTAAMGCKVDREGDGWVWTVWRGEQEATGSAPSKRAALDACEGFWAEFVDQLKARS